MDLALRCTCDSLRGVARGVAAHSGNHVVCYCRDCQAFAHFLGRAPDILDAQGGTEIFQMSPARIEIGAGADRLACMRLSPRGLLRWYASCCNTPIGNTLATHKFPFVGVIHLCLQAPEAGGALDPVLGPVRARAFRQFAGGEAAAIPPDRTPMPLLVARFVALMVRWKLRGDGARSVFFRGPGGSPTAEPRVLSLAERDELRRIVSPPPA